MVAVPPAPVKPFEAMAAEGLKLAVTVARPYDGGMQMTVNKQSSGLTVEEYLQRQIPLAPAAYLRQLCRQQKITCAAAPLTATDNLLAGQILDLPDSQRLLSLIEQAPPLNIVYETGQLMVVNKPAGLASHRTDRDEPDLTSLLQEMVKRRKEPYRLAPVTRLDRGTSGLLVFAKGKKSAAELGGQIMERSWRKTYLALVKGNPPREGTLEMSVLAKGKTKSARTIFRRLHSARGHALLEIDLETGRTHQIRQQFAASGFPLVGDRRYDRTGDVWRERLFLHCLRLDLPVTEDATTLSLTAPLTDELKRLLKTLWGKHWRSAPESL